MTILVTRPQPDNQRTAASLRARGFDVLLAPMLRFEAVPLQQSAGADYAAVIVTSANALRAVEAQLPGSGLLDLPLFAVGDRTAAAAREAGFRHVVSAGGDGDDLRELVAAQAKGLGKALGKAIGKPRGKTSGPRPLLYLAGADLSRDLAGELSEHGFAVVTQTAYRMAASAELPSDVLEAIADNRVEAVLHYSARSAKAFVEAARAAGVEISVLALPQCCISATVAAILRDAGAARVTVASSPDENSLFQAVDRALAG
jgi:uroporphyrinogen-III synthase